MNEKLNELRLDAGIARIENQQWLCVLDKETGMMIDPMIGLEKFAELIVRQMLEIADAHTEVFQTDRDRALIDHIKKSVKTHFGVES